MLWLRSELVLSTRRSKSCSLPCLLAACTSRPVAVPEVPVLMSQSRAVLGLLYRRRFSSFSPVFCYSSSTCPCDEPLEDVHRVERDFLLSVSMAAAAASVRRGQDHTSLPRFFVPSPCGMLCQISYRVFFCPMFKQCQLSSPVRK